MSKGIRRPVVKSPFEAKRVIVAACAAIAMVLGTMSVTTTVTSSDSTNSEVSAIIGSDGVNVKPKKPASTDLSRKHTLEVRSLLVQQEPAPHTVTPSTAAKNVRKTLVPVFSTLSPIFFLNQISQSANSDITPAVTTPADSDKQADAQLPADTSENQDPAAGDETTTPVNDENQPADPADSGTPTDSGAGEARILSNEMNASE